MKGTPIAKARKGKSTDDLTKARFSNVKSADEKHQVQWDEEMDEIKALIASERHRRRVSMATFPQTSMTRGSIKLTRLKPTHRGVQYAGRANGFNIVLNMHPGAHVGSKNWSRDFDATVAGLTRLVIWSELGDDSRLMTHFESDDGELSYPQRFIKRIVIVNIDGQPKSIPTDTCWYVIDKANKVVQYGE